MFRLMQWNYREMMIIAELKGQTFTRSVQMLYAQTRLIIHQCKSCELPKFSGIEEHDYVSLSDEICSRRSDRKEQ